MVMPTDASVSTAIQRPRSIRPATVHFTYETYADDDEHQVATTELLGVHVGTDGAVPFPDGIRARYSTLTEPAPEWAGRAVRPVRLD